MYPHLSLLPSVATADTAPHAVLSLRRPVVLHRVLMNGVVNFPSQNLVHLAVPTHQHPVTQRDESGRRVIAVLETGTAPTPIGRVSPSRMVRAANRTLHPFTKSVGLLPPASKAMLTFPRPSRPHPGNEEAVGSSVLFAVGSDGDSSHARSLAYVVQPGASEVNPLPVMAGISRRAVPVISIFAPQSSGRLISQPRKERNAVSQVESRTYRIATAVRSARRNHLRIAARDGVIDADETALMNALIAIETDLEEKADDERAAFALIRTGRTKHTRGIVVDLFPQIGPEAA